jgi:hypothetical protein
MSKGLITVVIMIVAAIVWGVLPSCRGDRTIQENLCTIYRNGLAMGSIQKNSEYEHVCYCANR